MSTIKKFLEGLLDRDVEWKSIEEIATKIFKGKGVKKNQIGSGDCPCIRYGDIHTSYEIWFDKCVSNVDPSLIKNPRYVEYGDIVLTCVSEDLLNSGKSCAYLGKKRAILSDGAMAFSHKQNPKYLAYALSTEFSRSQKGKLSQPGTTLVNLYPSNFKKLRIPIPSIEAQERIAETLDYLRFSKNNLIRHLKEEVGKRDKQYECYRDFILRLGGGLVLEFLFEIYQNFFFFGCSLQ